MFDRCFGVFLLVFSPLIILADMTRAALASLKAVPEFYATVWRAITGRL
jgi:hypothetical protein